VRIFTRNRDWHDDLTFYMRTVAASPDSVQMLIDLGQVYYNRGDLQSAEKEWVQARKIAPDYPILLDNLGALYTRQRRYDDAVDALQRCIQQSPEDVDAHVDLGQAYAQMGEAQPAEKELRAAVDLAPLNIQARTMLGEYYFALGRYREAAEQFRRSIDSIPTSKAYLGEGLAYLQMGEPEQAESDFKKAAAVDPHDSRPHFVLGYFYGEMGRTDEAIKEYTIGFKMNPDNQDARMAFQKLKKHDPESRVR
jgi:protein O-mannosyl-transferase